MALQAMPARGSNRLSRLVKAPKRYPVAPFDVSTLRLDADSVLRDGPMFRRLLDTFLVAQVRPELAIPESRPRSNSLRDKDGRHEVDVVIELAGGRVAGIEVKASAAAPSCTPDRGRRAGPEDLQLPCQHDLAVTVLASRHSRTAATAA